MATGFAVPITEWCFDVPWLSVNHGGEEWSNGTDCQILQKSKKRWIDDELFLSVCLHSWQVKSRTNNVKGNEVEEFIYDNGSEPDNKTKSD